MSGFIDAHCHLSDLRLWPRLTEIFARSERAGVTGFILGGIDPSDWSRQKAIARDQSHRVYPVFGVHPWVVDRCSLTEEGRREVERALDLLPEYLPQGVGLGELGLDYGKARSESSRPYQREIFKRQIEIAKKFDLPLVLHLVSAHADAIRILESARPYPRGGLVHAFSGSAEIALRYVDLGFTVSLGGALTREKGYETLKRAVKSIPEGRWVIESDSPDFIPDGYEGLDDGKGGRYNDPACLPSIAIAIAEIRGISAIKALEESRDRLARIFRLE